MTFEECKKLISNTTEEEKEQIRKELARPHVDNAPIENIEVTPELALKILKVGNNIRNFNKRHAKEIATSICLGNWRPNTAGSISINENGECIGGQHSLIAIMMSEKTVVHHIIYGINRDEEKVMDTTIKPHTSIEQGKQLTKDLDIIPEMSPVVGFILNFFETGKVERKNYGSTITDLFLNDPNYIPYIKDVSQHFKEVYPGKRYSIFSNKIVALAVELLTSMIDKDKSYDMFDRLYRNHVDEKEQKFLHSLREKLMGTKGDQNFIGNGGEKNAINLLLYAWEGVCLNRKCKTNSIYPRKEIEDSEGNKIKKYYTAPYDPNNRLSNFQQDIINKYIVHF